MDEEVSFRLKEAALGELGRTASNNIPDDAFWADDLHPKLTRSVAEIMMHLTNEQMTDFVAAIGYLMKTQVRERAQNPAKGKPRLTEEQIGDLAVEAVSGVKDDVLWAEQVRNELTKVAANVSGIVSPNEMKILLGVISYLEKTRQREVKHADILTGTATTH